MLKNQMAKTAQLSDFDDELYKVTENKDKPDTDKYRRCSIQHGGTRIRIDVI